MTLDDVLPGVPRWWDSGMETPVNHMVALAGRPAVRLYESAFAGLVSPEEDRYDFTVARMVLGARIGFALWTAARRSRASMDPLEVVLGQVIRVARGDAAEGRAEAAPLAVELEVVRATRPRRERRGKEPPTWVADWEAPRAPKGTRRR